MREYRVLSEPAGVRGRRAERRDRAGEISSWARVVGELCSCSPALAQGHSTR